MNTRLSYGLGTAAVALLLLPLGYQFLTSTALTPPGTIVTRERVETPPVPVDRPVAVEPTQQEIIVGADDELRQDPGPVVEPADPTNHMISPDANEQVQSATTGTTTEETDVDALPKTEAAPQSQTMVAAEGEAQRNLGGALAPAPMQDTANTAAVEGFAEPAIAPQMTMSPSEAMPQPQMQPPGDEFTDFSESPVKAVAEAPVSTFSIDVDTASYAYVRSSLNEGFVPSPDAVRVEELINYFPYDYPTPDSADAPFEPTVAVYPSPWSEGKQLVHIGIKGYEPAAGEDKPSNLTFLIDTSGSMDEPNKLPLLKRAFTLLVNQLSANDTVSIVVYAGSAGVVLEPTPATDKAAIIGALDTLWAGGSTAGAEGIELAYRLAEQNKVTDGVNRVILATDGDFNVGISDPNQLIDFVKQKRESGVFLSVLGFGMGNYQDDTMQALAQNGNGNAAYIDSFREAQKVLVEEGGSTLETIAKDVKIQIEFNPAAVSEYRLIGYETRALNREDFNNDRVDAGDIGAGHTVTAIYEITPAGSPGLVDPLRYENEGGDTPAAAVLPSAELGFLKLRYKLPDEDVSKLIELPIGESMEMGSLQNASLDMRFAAAVAAFGQKLKGSNYVDMSWDEIRSLAQGARGADELGYRAEFIQMIDGAALLSPDR
jgi:Ca-activated chloride channel homolog